MCNRIQCGSISTAIVCGAQAGCRLAGRLVACIGNGCARIVCCRNSRRIHDAAQAMVQAGTYAEVDAKFIITISGEPAGAIEIPYTTGQLLNLIVYKSISDIQGHKERSNQLWHKIMLPLSLGTFIPQEYMKECCHAYQCFNEDFFDLLATLREANQSPELTKRYGEDQWDLAEMTTLFHFRTSRPSDPLIKNILFREIDFKTYSIANLTTVQTIAVFTKVHETLSTVTHANDKAFFSRKEQVTLAIYSPIQIPSLIQLIFEYSISEVSVE